MISVAIPDLPKGLGLVAIRAISPVDFGSMLSAVRNDPAVTWAGRFKPYPVTDVTFEDGFSRLQIVITFRAPMTPGVLLITHITVTYRVDGQEGTQSIPQAFKIDTVDCKTRPKEFVCTGQPEPGPNTPRPLPSQSSLT